MEIREMKYLIEISQQKNVTHAANNLLISQPALHKILRKVETELDAKLFYKNGRHIYPTEIGKIVIEKSHEILSLIEHMETQISDIKNLKTGKVIFGFPSVTASLYLTEKLIAFQNKYPGIRLCTKEDGGARLLSMLEDGSLDVAIAMRPIYSTSINEIPITNERVVVCVHQSHNWASKNYVTVQDFKNTAFVTFNEDFCINKQIHERFRYERITPEFLLTGVDTNFLYNYALSTNSVLILPEPIVQKYSQNDNVKLIPFMPKFPWELSLIFPKNAYLSLATQTLITHMYTLFLKDV